MKVIKLDNILTIIGISIAIIIGIMTLFPSVFAPILQPWIRHILISILILILIIILYSLSIFQKIYQKIKKKYDDIQSNQLADTFFQEFKKKKFVERAIRVMPIRIKQTDNYGFINDSPQTFYDIMSRLKVNRLEFDCIPNIIQDISSSIGHFNYWNKWFKYFNKEKLDIVILKNLLEDFSFLTEECVQRSILRSLYEMCKAFEETKIEIDKDMDKNLTIAKEEYDAYRKDYNPFVREINEKFGKGTMSELPSVDTEYNSLLNMHDKIKEKDITEKLSRLAKYTEPHDPFNPKPDISDIKNMK